MDIDGYIDGSTSPGGVDVDFSSLFDRLGRGAEQIMDTGANALNAALLAAVEGETKFVADIPGSMVQKIKDGSVVLDRAKDGTLYAQFREGGRYAKKIPIREETFDGVSPAEMAAAAQLAAIKAQLEAIANTLNDIGEDVSLVLEGQRTDREALCQSGEETLIQALATSDLTMRKMLVAEGVKSLNDGRAQLQADFETHVNLLETGLDARGKKSRLEKIDEHVQALHRDFSWIHRSVGQLVGAFLQIGEPKAMTAVLRAYGRFIEKTIVPNQAMLIEYDKGDTKLIGGVWESRAEALKSLPMMGAGTIGADSIDLLLEAGSDSEDEL